MSVGSTTSRPTTSSTNATSSSTSAQRTHTVKKGENLWSIAQQQSGGRSNAEVSRYHQDLIKQNPQLKNPDQIRPGQQLNLPETGGTAASQSAPQAQQAPGADGRSSYEASSSAPPPQTARPQSGSSPAPASSDPALQGEVTARRTAAHANGARGGRGRAPSEDEAEQEAQAQTQAQPPPGSLAGRPTGGRPVMPNANVRGDNVRRSYENGTDTRSGTHRSNDETTRTRNRGAEQSRDSNSQTVETTRDGQRTTQLAEENQIRNRVTGQSESERTTVAQDQDGRTGSRTSNTSVAGDADARNRRQRIAHENGQNTVAGTGVLFDQRIAGDDKYRGVATVDNRHTTDDTGAGYEAHALAYRANANAAGTVDLRNGEVNVGVNGSLTADVVGVSGRAQVGSRDSLVGQAYAEGEARVGARAEGGAGIVVGPNQAGVRVGGEAFAGAEVKGTIGGENRYGGVSVTGRGQAGAGVAAGLDVGYNNGTVGVQADFGAAIGLGGRLTVDVNVNVGAIASDAVSAGRSAVNTVADNASRAWSAVNPFD